MLHTLPILVSLLTQAAPNAGAALQPKERAQALLKEGSALYKQADYAAALEKFEAAYALYPSPKLQFNIAQADRALGRTVEAVEAFETFLVQAPDAAPEILAEARQSLAELKPKLAQLRIDAPPGAQVTVDERPFGFAPILRIVWVMPGPHRVSTKLPTYLPASTDVTVTAGEIRTVTPQLIRAGEPAAAPAPPAPPPPAPPPALPPPVAASPEAIVSAPPAPAQTERSTARKPWYIWTAAATVAFTGAAIATGLSANGKYNDLEKTCGVPGTCSDAQVDEVKSRATLANVFWILAGASAVATGVTFYVDSREAKMSVALKF